MPGAWNTRADFHEATEMIFGRRYGIQDNTVDAVAHADEEDDRNIPMVVWWGRNSGAWWVAVTRRRPIAATQSEAAFAVSSPAAEETALWHRENLRIGGSVSKLGRNLVGISPPRSLGHILDVSSRGSRNVFPPKSFYAADELRPKNPEEAVVNVWQNYTQRVKFRNSL
ncbi:hypothetical protein VTO73DRAFT_6384 [Trametes versicolor]